MKVFRCEVQNMNIIEAWLWSRTMGDVGDTNHTVILDASFLKNAARGDKEEVPL